MKLNRCSNQETSGDCPTSHRISSVTDTHDEVASVPDDLPASLDGQATQDEILSAVVIGRPDHESSAPAPGAAVISRPDHESSALAPAAAVSGRPDHESSAPAPAAAVSGSPDHESSAPAPGAFFSWGDLDGGAFCRVVEDCYEEVVQWKRNIFLIPSGGAGKAFVDEVARLFQSYADNDAIEPIALKACIVSLSLVAAEASKAKQG